MILSKCYGMIVNESPGVLDKERELHSTRAVEDTNATHGQAPGW